MGGGERGRKGVRGRGEYPYTKKTLNKVKKCKRGITVTKLHQFPPKDLITITRYGKYRPLY